ncbi:MAG: PD-(D/E)XK nuclease family protein [Oscillospiraceae bacterium]|nr:PD-(D/E)XK nuclease family protein [Oscillospiraceae bacterium]
MLHLVLGRIKSGKTSCIINELASRREEGSLLVVPERLSHSVERLLCKRCGNTVSSYAEVTSFRRLAARIKGEIGGVAAETVGDGKRMLLLYSAIKSVSPALSKLKKAATNPQRLSGVIESIDEFKAYGITPEELLSACGNVSKPLGEKLKDLAAIYAAYENGLGEEECDSYDELGFVAAMLRKEAFFKDKTVFLDGFSGFTKPEFDIIESAFVQARDVYITLELPGNASEGEENGIFDKAITTKKKLINLCEKNGIAWDETVLCKEKETTLSVLDEIIFNTDSKKYPCEGCITVARADGAFHECELSAAYIIDSIRKNGMRYRDFSVAITDEEKYIGICEMVYSRYGIPVYINRADDITQKPAVAIILSALSLIQKNFKPAAVMEYIKTGFSGICSKSLDIFENYLYMWEPRASEWKSGEDFTKNPLGFGVEENDEGRELLRIVNRVRRKISEPIKHLSGVVSKGCTGERAAAAIYDFINEINLPRRCDAYSYLSKLMGDFKTAQEYDGMLSVICDVIDSIGTVCGEDDITLDELCELFRITASKYTLSTIPATLDSVSVSSLARAEGERARVRIVLGANDGAFPKTADHAGILSDRDRGELSDCGIELAPALTERVFEDFRVIHNVLCTAEEALYISSDSSGKAGEESPEASAVLRIKDTFDGISGGFSLADARRCAKIPCFDESIARGELSDFWEMDAEEASRLMSVREAKSMKRGPIKKRENIEALFGNRIYLSASRAEKFISCRYAYFLRYGMKAFPRERAEISPIQAGDLLHYVLENVLKRLSKAGRFDSDYALALSEGIVREYVALRLGGEAVLSGRMDFLISRLEKTVRAALCDICSEIEKGEFRPRDFELEFSFGEDGLSPIEINGETSTVLFGGVIDRVDTYERDGELYFRVMDYKSGTKTFSLDESVNGIGMQMLLYMFALEDMAEKHYGRGAKPAGIMYIPLAQSFSQVRGEAAPRTRRAGVVINDTEIINAMESGEEKVYLPVKINKNGTLSKTSSILSKEGFEAVKTRTREILARIGDELSRGEIEANPYIHRDFNSCKWCEYKAVCAFDERAGCDKMRDLIEVSAKEITGEGEVSDIGGNEMD